MINYANPAKRMGCTGRPRGVGRGTQVKPLVATTMHPCGARCPRGVGKSWLVETWRNRVILDGHLRALPPYLHKVAKCTAIRRRRSTDGVVWGNYPTTVLVHSARTPSGAESRASA